MKLGENPHRKITFNIILFLIFRSLTIHIIQTKHNTNMKTVYCNYCNKSYKSRQSVYTHIGLKHAAEVAATKVEKVTEDEEDIEDPDKINDHLG